MEYRLTSPFCRGYSAPLDAVSDEAHLGALSPSDAVSSDGSYYKFGTLYRHGGEKR